MPDLQEHFAEKMMDLLERATQLMPPPQVFEAAIGGLCSWALLHAPGPAVAETLRLLAAELQSHRIRERRHDD